MPRIFTLILWISFASIAFGTQYRIPTVSSDRVLLEFDKYTKIFGTIQLWTQRKVNLPNYGSQLILESIAPPEYNNIYGNRDRRKYSITLESDLGRVILMEDNLSDSSYATFIQRLIMPRSERALIIETETIYREHNGHHDFHNLTVFFFNNDGSVTEESLRIGERGFVSSASDVASELDLGYSIVYDSDFNEYIYVNTHKMERLYLIDTNNSILVNVSNRIPLLEPSFDCDLSLNFVESVICNDPGLSSLDSILNSLYQDNTSIDGIVESQRNWLNERNDCTDEPRIVIKSCLSERYRDRIIQLNELSTRNLTK